MLENGKGGQRIQREQGDVAKGSSAPLVSIVCPAFNSEEFIAISLASVISQTWDGWELIVVDDGSTDSTLEIAKTFAELDSRIHVIEMGSNRGRATARNVGLQRAVGRWVAFLDSDDYWLPDRLLRGIEFAKGVGASLVYSAYRPISNDGKSVGKIIIVPKFRNYQDLLESNVIVTSSVLVDRAVVGKFQMVNAESEDFLCWLDILKRIPFAHGLSEDVVRYRWAKGSSSRDKKIALLKVWRIYRKHEGIGVAIAILTIIKYAFAGMSKYVKIRFGLSVAVRSRSRQRFS